MTRYVFLAAVVLSVLAAGCRHRCCRLNEPGRQPRPFLPSAPNSPYLLPPAGLPTTPTPSGESTIAPSVGPAGPSNYPPPVLGPITSPAPSKPPTTPPPAEILFPDPLPGTSSRSASPGDPGHGVLGGPAKPPTTEPPMSLKPATGPTGLAGSVRVKDGIASGRLPGLDGFNALKQSGYRTILYLHPSGADLSALQDVVTKRGLALVTIETTPERLPLALAAFNSALADPAARPLFVADDDGLRAGYLWYLHFRTVEAMNDDLARIRAKPLGLTDNGEEARAFALATQRYLETR